MTQTDFPISSLRRFLYLVFMKRCLFYGLCSRNTVAIWSPWAVPRSTEASRRWSRFSRGSKDTDTGSNSSSSSNNNNIPRRNKRMSPMRRPPLLRPQVRQLRVRGRSPTEHFAISGVQKSRMDGSYLIQKLWAELLDPKIANRLARKV